MFYIQVLEVWLFFSLNKYVMDIIESIEVDFLGSLHLLTILR